MLKIISSKALLQTTIIGKSMIHTVKCHALLTHLMASFWIIMQQFRINMLSTPQR